MSDDDVLFRDLCENASDLIQSVTPDGRFIYVNQAWLRSLGYRREEVADLNIWDIVHPDSREHCERLMRQVMGGQPETRIEADFCRKDGERIHVQGSAGCRLADGKPVGTVGIFRDVTRNQRATEERNRLFELSLDLLCVAGTDGFFKQINPAFEKTLGYDAEELLSRSFLEFVHPDDRPGTVEQIQILKEGRPVIDFQNRYLAKDGTYRWLDWRATPLPGTELVYAVARDVTEQKRIELQLSRRTEELARSNSELEQFAHVASHDLRAPLRAVANLAEWIREKLPDEASDKVRQHLHQLRTRVERMQSLTEELLRYARAGTGPAEIVHVDTGEMLREVVAFLAPPAGFAIEIDPGMPVLKTNRATLEQVFRNLIENAIKHHDRDRGRIEISARRLDGVHEFVVSDDGPGIPPESHDEIFEMFSGARSQEGSGISLALVKRVIERQGGKITVESQADRGASFRFVWPETGAAEPV